MDPELADAMAGVDPHPRSRARLIRDLALEGARVERDRRRRSEEAVELFLKISSGEIELDLAAAAAAHAEREAGFE